MDEKKYYSWQVPELKAELRRRGASTKGRKSGKRLELYDKNFNFVTPQLSPNPDPSMVIPPAESYHDINGDSLLPPIEKEHIRYYFERFNKHLSASEKLYESRFLLVARSAIVNEHCYIKGFVKKTMKKLQYQVDIKLESNGAIEECHCECPAGAGTEAHCKHVGVVLLAINHVHKEKVILTFESPTQIPQTFNRPRKGYGGTPVRAQHLPSKKIKNIIFEPFPIKTINKTYYNTRIRNIILNSKSTMPLKQLCEPANPVALQNDHDYLKLNQQELLLQNLKLSKITSEEISEIEQMTLGQNKNAKWHEYRSCRITASNFHTVCKLQSKSQESLAKQLLNRKPFMSRATAHGLINEEVALKKYAEENCLLPSICGLFISKERPYLSASPDALLGEETIIEIKCPFSSRHRKITPESVPYLIIENGEITLKKTSPYYYQIQGQLYCSGRKFCNLIVYTYKDMKVIYIRREEAFINEMILKLEHFYHTFFQAEIINKYLYKYYHDVIKTHKHYLYVLFIIHSLKLHNITQMKNIFDANGT